MFKLAGIVLLGAVLVMGTKEVKRQKGNDK